MLERSLAFVDAQMARLAAMRNSVLALAFAYAGSAVLQKGVGFILFLWLAHQLSVSDYARFGLLYALQSGVSALAMAGIVETAIGRLKVARDPERQRRLLAGANLVFLGTATMSVLLAIAGFSWTNAFDTRALLVAAASGALIGFYTIQSQLSRIVERHRAALSVGLVAPLIGLLGGLAGYLIFGSSVGFFVGSTAGLLLALPLTMLTAIGFSRSVRDEDVRYMAAHLAPYLLVALIDWFAGYGNTYLVKIFFSTDVVARFVFAYTLSSIMHLVATSLNQAWNPRVFRLIHDAPSRQVEVENRRFYLLQGLALGAAAGGILALLPWALRIGGASFAHYQGIERETAILFLAYVLNIPWYHVQNYYYAHARGALLMKISVGTSIVGLLLWIAAALTLGELGPYVGFMLMMIAKMAGGVFWARREWKVGLLWHGPAAGVALLALGELVGLLLA
ncbi:hypothetical protein JMG10_23045 [Nostoc ellipsosporum NOK]|uniref:lipopolysaccharide biosynthesis protein n=1 Tax=Sphingomonas sp. IBVSS2 TaxID=1985172 RepID=UPI000A2DF56D|nr:hypothetical protein [Sphingomonas sp. IBVSS2]MDF2384367.1 hypothetical protein [Nostoc ellipsosporum NOK]OSZ68499.1 hypothetical protein CAP40_07920 [Sphingomonas sp. IBVSS2]